MSYRSSTLEAIALSLMACLLTATATFAALAGSNEAELDLRSIPISDWLDEGEKTAIPWRLDVSNARLRMDQRLEVVYTASIRSRDLQRIGGGHELFMVSRFSSPDGEWLNQPDVMSHIADQDLPSNMEVRFSRQAFIQPGDYLLWLVLYDRQSGNYNVAKRRVRVSEIRRDPLANAFAGLPLIEIPEVVRTETGTVTRVSSERSLPVSNTRPVDVQLISAFSPPEQWAGRSRASRNYTAITMSALSVMSRLNLAQGSISLAGLDLVRRDVLFDQRDFRTVNWTALTRALRRADSPLISTDALEGRRDNAAFFREFLDQRISAHSPDASDPPLQVFIVLAGSLLFERGSDLAPLEVEEGCHCRTYHIRFRLSANDVFDELHRLIRPLRPRTFNVSTPHDLRRAIGEIVRDLENL